MNQPQRFDCPTARVSLPVSLVSPANPVNRLENNRNPVIKLANPVNNPAISRDNPGNPDREANPVDRAVVASPEASIRRTGECGATGDGGIDAGG